MVDDWPTQTTGGTALRARVGVGFTKIVWVTVAVPETATDVVTVIEKVPAVGKVIVVTEALGVPNVGPAGDAVQVYPETVTVAGVTVQVVVCTAPLQTGLT